MVQVGIAHNELLIVEITIHHEDHGLTDIGAE
jgi:hypothetical protein